MAKKSNGKDIEELENAFQDLSGSPKGKSAPSKQNDGGNKKTSLILIIVCLCLVAAIILVGVILVVNINKDNNTIKSNLSIMGVRLKGLSQGEAVETITQEFDRLYGSDPIIVTIDGEDLKLTPQDTCIALNAADAVQAALNYKQPTKGTVALDISQYIALDTNAVKLILNKLAGSIDSDLKQSEYEVVGQAPENMDEIDDEASQVLKITMGTPGKKLDQDAVIAMILSTCSAGETTLSYNCPVSDPDPIDLKAIEEQYCTYPVEAEFEEKTYKVLGGTFGYAFDHNAVSDALSKATPGKSMEFKFTWTAPETTAKELNSQLFRDELATYTTNQYSDSNRATNLRLACEAVNNLVLYPGDTFSFNGTLGERTAEKGYKPGASYVGGETVMDIGGGICQVATTIYYCTILSDLQVVERDCHTYASSYTPLSTDATVFWGGIDYKFKNSSEYPIRIEATADGGTVTVSLIGTDTKDYYVEFESVHLDTYPYKTVYKEFKEGNSQGYSDGKVLTSPYTGYKSEGWSVKYDKVTGEEISRTKVSTDVYHTRDKVVVKIIESEEEETEGPGNVTEGTGGENEGTGGENEGTGGNETTGGESGGENENTGGESSGENEGSGETPENSGE